MLKLCDVAKPKLPNKKKNNNLHQKHQSFGSKPKVFLDQVNKTTLPNFLIEYFFMVFRKFFFDFLE